ncbi:MAG: hypothetical protein ACK5Q4_14410 [Phycisphaerae bacterium]
MGTAGNTGLTAHAPRSTTQPAAEPTRATPTDPDLAAIIAAWPTLPAAMRAGVVAMVKAAAT